MQANFPALIFYIVSYGIGLLIFYYVVKAAVRNGIIEAELNKRLDSSMSKPKASTELPFSNRQKELQEKYNQGLISFEDYQLEWKEQ